MIICNSINWNIILKWEDLLLRFIIIVKVKFFLFIFFLILIEKIIWMIWDLKLVKVVYKIKWLMGLYLENVRLKNIKIYDSLDICKKGECLYFMSFFL